MGRAGSILPKSFRSEPFLQQSVFSANDRELRDELQQIAIRAYGQDSQQPIESKKDTTPTADVSEDVKKESIKNEKFDDGDIPF